jgi:hypothetical protein
MFWLICGSVPPALEMDIEGFDEELGVWHLNASAPTLVVASYLQSDLTFAGPPVDLFLESVECIIVQNFTLRSPRQPQKVVQPQPIRAQVFKLEGKHGVQKNKRREPLAKLRAGQMHEISWVQLAWWDKLTIAQPSGTAAQLDPYPPIHSRTYHLTHHCLFPALLHHQLLPDARRTHQGQSHQPAHLYRLVLLPQGVPRTAHLLVVRPAPKSGTRRPVPADGSAGPERVRSRICA